MNKFKEPWASVPDPEKSNQLESELYREVVAGHALHKETVRALAYRIDRDDVLFKLEDNKRVAVVHLTYSAEDSPDFPSTQLFESIEEFEKKRMQPDHDEYNL